MLLITCEDCERRTLRFEVAPEASCPECGAATVARREVKIDISVEHDDFPELTVEAPREDLIFTG